jgi:hypothetical protein
MVKSKPGSHSKVRQVWAAQSLSVIGSSMTGFALNVYLAQVLYPAPEQKGLAC